LIIEASIEPPDATTPAIPGIVARFDGWHSIASAVLVTDECWRR